MKSSQVHTEEGQASTRKRSVSFDSVHVHEHTVVLGDNPSVSSGLPIALGERSLTETMDIDEYEEYERRHRGANRLSKKDRARLIRQRHTRFSMMKAKRELKQIKKSRLESSKQFSQVFSLLSTVRVT